jgi:hypothetical protein
MADKESYYIYLRAMGMHAIGGVATLLNNTENELSSKNF